MDHETELLRWRVIEHVAGQIADDHGQLLHAKRLAAALGELGVWRDEVAEHIAEINREARIEDIEIGEAIIVALLSGALDPHRLAATIRTGAVPSPIDCFPPSAN